MTSSPQELIELSACEIARRVRERSVGPREVLSAFLDRIARVDGDIGAFQLVRTEAALAEAEALSRRGDLGELALAGVPVAIKDNVDVAGEPTRHGSRATPATPAAADHEIVKRLRGAGAIVIGKTRVPEFCAWAWTDGADGVTRNPWDVGFTAGGSSGGAAAAVAARMVPLAQGSDAGGSIRVPSAACGLFGIKPGTGVVPPTTNTWFGLSELGPLATTVDDAALALAVMSARNDLARPILAERPLAIAVSLAPPFVGLKLDATYAAAVRRVSELLTGLGHAVSEADPPYGGLMLNAAARVFAGVAVDARGLSRSELQPRSRTETRLGELVLRFGLMRDSGRDRWRARASDFFTRFDLLLTPALLTRPVAAERWSERSFIANLSAGSFAPYTGPWNLAGYPAAAVPSGLGDDGFPRAVQLVGPAGAEALVLSVARQIESAQPWPRHPGADRERSWVGARS